MPMAVATAAVGLDFPVLLVCDLLLPLHGVLSGENDWLWKEQPRNTDRCEGHEPALNIRLALVKGVLVRLAKTHRDHRVDEGWVRRWFTDPLVDDHPVMYPKKAEEDHHWNALAEEVSQALEVERV